MSGVLEGIRILDLSAMSPGPYATMLLADMGAEVLMIERPDGGPSAEDARWSPLRRNKQSVVLDLKDPAERERFYALVPDYDVVVEGYRPGVARRLGVDFDTLRALRADLVYCSITGYGQHGPWATLPGHDVNYLAAAGALSVVGEDDHPVIPLNVIADYGGGGAFAALGILACLVEQPRRARYIDHALADGVLHQFGNVVTETARAGRPYGYGEHRLGGGDPLYACYRCADGKWLSISALEPKFQAALAAGIEINLEDADRLAARFAEKPRDEWFAILAEAGNCVAPVLDMQEVMAAEHFRARGTFIEVDGVTQVAPVPRIA
jgi:alpha-methylacyl-CoA racemase